MSSSANAAPAPAQTECQVCAEKYNKSNRLPVECGFCDFAACRSCYKQYIPSLTEEVKCMSCKKNWDRTAIHSKFEASYVNTILKNRRENILIDREKTLMAETQPEVERIKLDRVLMSEIMEQENEIYLINKKIRNLYKDRAAKLQEFDHQHMTVDGGNSTENLRLRVKLIKKCTFNNCKGFLSSVWKCGLCSNWTCPECFEVRGTEKNAEHVCNPDNIATAKLIKSDTRSCPNCNEGIYKIEGCAQMWCTSCKTPFDWNTGKIIAGNIHNPHYFEWRRDNHNYDRDPHDVICGRELTTRFLNRFYRLKRENATDELKRYETRFGEIIRKIIEFKDYEIRANTVNIVRENRELRIQYLLDQITEEQLKITLQRKEKYMCKRGELTNIYTMFVQCATDIIYRLSDNSESKDVSNTQLEAIYSEIHTEIESLKTYTNNCLLKLGKVYNSSVRVFNENFNFVKPT